MASFHLLEGKSAEKRTTTKYQRKKKDKGSPSDSNNLEIKEHFEHRTLLNKTPQLLELTGPLARMNSSTLFDKVNLELVEVQKHSGNEQLIPFVETKFEKMKGKQDDLAVMELVMGYNRIACLTMKVDQLPAYFKKLFRSLHTCNVRHLNVIECMINFPLFQKNLFQKKFGKAWKCAQASTSHVQSVAPNAWTAVAYDIRAKMYEILAQVTPHAKNKHLAAALDCYRIAREHVLIQPCQEDQNCVLKIIFLTLQMVFLTLKIPCLSTINMLGNKDIIAEPLSIATITNDELQEAEAMTDTIKNQLSPMEGEGYVYRLKEESHICDIVLAIRRAQLYMQNNDFKSALNTSGKAEECYNIWDKSYSKDKISQHVKCPVLKTELSSLIQTMKSQALILSQEYEGQSECKHGGKQHMQCSKDYKENVKIEEGQEKYETQTKLSNNLDSLLNADALSFGDNENVSTASSAGVDESSSNFESLDSDVLEGY